MPRLQASLLDPESPKRRDIPHSGMDGQSMWKTLFRSCIFLITFLCSHNDMKLEKTISPYICLLKLDKYVAYKTGIMFKFAPYHTFGNTGCSRAAVPTWLEPSYCSLTTRCVIYQLHTS